MDSSLLQTFKSRLEEERDRLLKELSMFSHRDTKSKEDDFETNQAILTDSDDEEDAAKIAQYVDNLSIEEDLERSLRDIEKAIKSIENGTYGTCKYCGGPIDMKRLEARPDSSSCIECKRTFTKEVL